MTGQKLAHLKQLLERWKSHNEVHAKPADGILYEFMSELLKSGYEDEQPSSEQEPESQIGEIATSFDPAGDDAGPGGNHPEDPSGKP